MEKIPHYNINLKANMKKKHNEEVVQIRRTEL